MRRFFRNVDDTLSNPVFVAALPVAEPWLPMPRVNSCANTACAFRRLSCPRRPRRSCFHRGQTARLRIEVEVLAELDRGRFARTVTLKDAGGLRRELALRKALGANPDFQLAAP